MKFLKNIKNRSHRKGIRGFTLVEMLFAAMIFVVFLIGVMVSIQLFGLRVYTLAATKLSATAGSRKALNQIRDSIREAKTLQIGTCASASLAAFSAITGTNMAQGNALLVYATTDSVPYTLYYLDTSTAPTNKLMAYIAKGSNSTVSSTVLLTLASYITNTLIFDAEDYQGNIVTNSAKNNQLYAVTLQFYQWEYPVAHVGNGGMYDYYQLRTKVCRRATD